MTVATSDKNGSSNFESMFEECFLEAALTNKLAQVCEKGFFLVKEKEGDPVEDAAEPEGNENLF